MFDETFHALFKFCLFISAICITASGAIVLGVDRTAVLAALTAIVVAFLALVLAFIFVPSLPWRIRVVRFQENVRATTARLTTGAVKVFYSANSRAFIVSMADAIKDRYSGAAIPDVVIKAYRTDGIEHLDARWPAPGGGMVTDTVVTFRVDQAFDDSWPDPTDLHPYLPVGDMVDAFVLANLIDAAARGQAPWDAAVANHVEAHESIA